MLCVTSLRLTSPRLQVSLERYDKVRASTFGLKRGNRIAVIRAEGAITGAASGGLGLGGQSIKADQVSLDSCLLADHRLTCLPSLSHGAPDHRSQFSLIL